ncbi:MAG: hypothetical protein ACKO0U_13205 [Gammaproteobacteria bacterium]
MPAALAATLLSIGPLTLGMSLEEVRAALPAAQWENVAVSRYSERVFRIHGTGGLTLAGLPLEVDAEVHYYHQGFRLRGRFPVQDARTCEQSALAWLAAVEPQVGPFTSREPHIRPGTGGNLQWHSSRGPHGIVLTPSMGPGTPSSQVGELVSVGTASRVLIEAHDEAHRPRARRAWLSKAPASFKLTAERVLPEQELDVEVEYLARGPQCSLNLMLVRQQKPPPPAEFDTRQARIAFQPNLAMRHWMLPDAVAAAAAPVEVALRCQIDRAVGMVTGCGRTTGDPLPAVFETYAHRLARETYYDTRGVDRDDPQPMTGEVRVRLDPADRRPIDFLDAPRTPLEQVVFTVQPAEEQRVIPLVRRDWGLPPNLKAALGGDIPEGAPLELTVTCQILTDGSLLCGGGRWVKPPENAAFRADLEQEAARVAAVRYEVARQLKDGSPSPGKVLELPLRFAF